MGFKASSPWLKSLEGKHVLITGGSTGIGFAIAKEALSQGTFITLLARSSSKLEKAADNLAKHCGNTDKICSKIADVGEYESVAKAIKESFQWRPIDVLVCNAGVAKTGIMDETRIEDQHAIIQTNFTGVFNTLHAGLPLMKTRSAQTPMSVVIINALSGLYMLYGNAINTATKHGLKGLAEVLKVELRPYNIRVSVVYPGYTETPMLDDCGLEDDKEILRIIKLTSLYNRSNVETPEQVAKYTLEGTKNGTFLITSQFSGLVLSTYSRGPIPADSFGRALVELILYIPLRLFSFFVAWYVYYVRRHSNHKK